MQIFKNKFFLKWANSEGLSDLALIKAAQEINRGLVSANLGGSLVKKRVARKGGGKSSGFRTIVVFQKEHRAIFIYGFLKNQRDNISELEERALKKLAKGLLEASDKELREMIANGDLYEVKS